MEWAEGTSFDVEVDVLVVGAGASGLVAALAAAQKGAEVLVLEKSSRPGGNTAKSTGMVIGAGTRFQRQAGLIEATPENLMADIFKKNRRQSPPELTRVLAHRSASVVEWLVDEQRVDLRLVEDFKYPGHTQFWMHSPLSRSGVDLVSDLLRAIDRYSSIELLADSPVLELIHRDGAVMGAVVQTTEREAIGARKTILAANGFGANREMVARYCSEIAGALYFGHEGNTGEAIGWGRALGAALDCMNAYQGHGSIAHPLSVPITWAVIMNGGFLVGRDGRRFGDESAGYSEFAREVVKQPEGLAYEVLDERILQSAQAFADMRECMREGVFVRRDSIEELAGALHVDPAGLAEELRVFNETARGVGSDRFGRQVGSPPLEPPFVGARVTSALFHTQGGLRVDAWGRVLKEDNTPIPNLYAGGGTAAGLSGNTAEGYFSGNGLLTAIGLGKLAAEHAVAAIHAGC